MLGRCPTVEDFLCVVLRQSFPPHTRLDSGRYKQIDSAGRLVELFYTFVQFYQRVADWLLRQTIATGGAAGWTDRAQRFGVAQSCADLSIRRAAHALQLALGLPELESFQSTLTSLLACLGSAIRDTARDTTTGTTKLLLQTAPSATPTFHAAVTRSELILPHNRAPPQTLKSRPSRNQRAKCVPIHPVCWCWLHRLVPRTRLTDYEDLKILDRRRVTVNKYSFCSRAKAQGKSTDHSQLYANVT